MSPSSRPPEPAARPALRPRPLALPDTDRWVEIGRIGRPHGIKGQLHIQVHNPDSPLWRAGLVLRAWKAGAPAQALRLLELRPAGADFVATFEGLPDRSAAEPLTHCLLQVAEDDLPGKDDDEVYLHELLGAAVHDADTDAQVGTISGFIETNQLLLDIRLLAGGTALVPAQADAVVALGREPGKVVIAHIEDWRST
ncbi:MAG: 16S rRNA processing protein RimM [Deltaproteobacteria bacterium]|nr:16S rRNA processing protein RimM [Deltaproteobacteria bacterium]